MRPNKPRGVPRADDRRVLNGIYWPLRTGLPWADIPERYGPVTTCANRFRHWVRIGVWDCLLRHHYPIRKARNELPCRRQARRYPYLGAG